jgi:Tol biopolymer transport system component
MVSMRPRRLLLLSVLLLLSLHGATLPLAFGQDGPPVVDMLLNAEDEQRGHVVAPGVISSPDSSESSPSMTADGRTMVFTRYASYREQVPYIATRTGDADTSRYTAPVPGSSHSG